MQHLAVGTIPFEKTCFHYIAKFGSLLVIFSGNKVSPWQINKCYLLTNKYINMVNVIMVNIVTTKTENTRNWT